MEAVSNILEPTPRPPWGAGGAVEPPTPGTRTYTNIVTDLVIIRRLKLSHKIEHTSSTRGCCSLSPRDTLGGLRGRWGGDLDFPVSSVAVEMNQKL